ncbi:hypothetical protein H072_4701 [Dactylellina haptotyla CBS 200.50]|uniref:DUF7732 domain-containing protein n=1 Tax=Dactylellina haptotyla (strain CBS 200.50) TaxID=1284197 RepID=S8AET4_DACHA|nr:hypothetical protein H072_4701 [Dactylellina haptotyla CBS 200.50]
MKYSILHAAATTVFLTSLSQLPGVSAIEPAPVHARAIAHIQPLDDAESVSERIHFGKRAIKHDKPLDDAEQVAHRITFGAIKHVQPLSDAEDVAHRVSFDKRGEVEEKRAVARIQQLDDAADVAERIHFNPLEKRKGGGGGGKSGGGGGSGGKTSSGGKSSSSGGKTKSSGGKTSSGGSSGGKSSSSGKNNKGYKTYGGRYGGGSTSGYKAGGRSPLGLVPFLLPLAAVALIFPGLWLYSVYSYHYNTAYQYYNNTLQSLQNVPVQCLCMQYSDCSCDDNGNTTYLSDLIALNQSNTTTFAIVDGVWTLLINGTVENGTGAIDSGDSTNGASPLNIIGYLWMAGVAVYLAYSM